MTVQIVNIGAAPDDGTGDVLRVAFDKINNNFLLLEIFTDLVDADGNFIVGSPTGWVVESGATARASLGLIIGTDVQAYDAFLASIADLGMVADRIIYTTALDTAAETTLTPFARTLIDDLTATVARGTLSAAPNDATYITQTANGELSTEQALAPLVTGLVKNTTGTGVLSIAVEGTDYSSLPVVDTTFIVKGSADASKLFRLEVDGFTPGVTRVGTPPDQDFTIAGLEVANVFTVGQMIDGSVDEVQFTVQANGTQTTNVQEWQDSSGALIADITSEGNLGVAIIDIDSTDDALTVGTGKTDGTNAFTALFEFPKNVVLTPAGGGSLGAGTYYVRVSCTDPDNNHFLSKASVEVSIAINGTTETSIDVSWDDVIGEPSYTLWLDTSPLADGGSDSTAVANTNSDNLNALPLTAGIRQRPITNNARSIHIAPSNVYFSSEHYVFGNSARGNTLVKLRTASGGRALFFQAGTAGSEIKAIGSGNDLWLATSLATVQLRPLSTTVLTASTTTQNVLIEASNSAVVPLVVKGDTSQSANLTEWQDSNGDVVGTFGVGTDAATDTITDNFTIGHNSPNTPTTNFGTGLLLRGKSSTTIDQKMVHFASQWATATHATRKARGIWSAYDTAEREAIRIEASGSAAMLGFYGVAAVVRPTALTTALTQITHTGPTTPDYAIATPVDSGVGSAWGFSTQDEFETAMSVALNLQTRVDELETKIQSLGLLT